jgi:hypothetical protein
VFAVERDVVTLDATRSLWPPPAAADAGAPEPWFEWIQVEGTPVQWVRLEGDGPEASIVPVELPEGPAPRFVAPQPGRYAFDVSVSNGVLRSPAARALVYVRRDDRELPTADARAPAVVVVGEPVELDGTRSVGPAGLPIRHAWRQVAGPPAGLTDADLPAATVVPFEAGWYEFELAVHEGESQSPPARVAFEARAAGVAPLGVTARGPAQVLPGARVELRGAASPPGSRVRWRWTQVEGPWIALEGADSAAPTFVPKVPGPYTFELVAERDGVRSPPASVTVLVEGEE